MVYSKIRTSMHNGCLLYDIMSEYNNSLCEIRIRISHPGTSTIAMFKAVHCFSKFLTFQSVR